MAMYARLSACVIILSIGVFAEALAQKRTKFETSALTIQTKTRSHKLDVEMARTPEQLAFGLMFRRSLPANAGMLFDYGRPQVVAMWMKNTFIPLDMVFIDEKGVVAHIAQRAVPQSLRTISSITPVRAVLELNGGTVARLKIEKGDRVNHRIFQE